MPPVSPRRPFRRVAAALTLALALVLSTLVAAPAQAANGSITGVVKSRVDGKTTVLPNATVVLDKFKDNDDFFTDSSFRSTTTGAQGRYNLGKLPNGRYQVRIYPPSGNLGYEYYDDKWSPYGSRTVVVKGGRVALKDVVLEPVGWFTGKVTDTDGKPIPGASVMIQDTPTSGGYGFAVNTNGTFDSRTGNWTTNLIPGTYHVEAYAWGNDIEGPVYVSKKVATTIRPGRATAIPTFQLERRKTVVVTVRDTDGTPLAHAPIEVFLQQNGTGAFKPAAYGPIQTDAEGKYRFTSGAANYKFRVHPPKGYTGTGVAEYWDGGTGAYAYKDAATLAFGASEPMKRNITVQLGPAPSIKAPTPTVAGKVVVGNTVTAKSGAWTPRSVKPSYEWLKNGVALPKQSKRKLKITPAVAKGLQTLSVRITGDLAGEDAVDSTSNERKPTLRATKPKIKGKKRVGKKLTARPGNWRPGKVNFRYQWLRNGKPIKAKAAKKKVYKLIRKDRGKRISVRVTGTKPNHLKVTKVSKRTKKIRRR